MSPWTLLGWILLGVVVFVVGLRVLIVIFTLLDEEGPKIKAAHKYKRALKGKVTCEYIGWESEDLPGQEDIPSWQRKYERTKVVCARPATHATSSRWRRYFCEEHAKTVRGGNDYPQPLHRPESTHKTKVIS